MALPLLQHPGTPPVSPSLGPTTPSPSSIVRCTSTTTSAAHPPQPVSSPLSSSASSAYRDRLIRGVTRLIPESPRKALRRGVSGAAALLAPVFPGGSHRGDESCDEDAAGASSSSINTTPRSAKGTLARLPPEVLQRIFQLLMIESSSFSVVRVLSLVSRHWYGVVQHRSMWLHTVKMFFVSYPVVQRLARAAPIDAADEEALLRTVYNTKYLSGKKRSTDNMASSPTAATTNNPVVTAAEGTGNAPPSTSSVTLAWSRLTATGGEASDEDPGGTLELSNVAIRKAFKDVRRYLASRRYHELVLRRRAFVIHAFVSLALLCFSMALMTAMCSAERIFDGIAICESETSFQFVWLTYLSVCGAVLANIVMETHFEPQPLIRRLRMHTQLIQLSAVLLSASLVLVGLPTLLIQWNVRAVQQLDVLAQHQQQESVAVLGGTSLPQLVVVTDDAAAAPYLLPWAVCILPVLLALVAWQVEVLYAVRRDIVEFMQMPYFNSATMYHGFSYSLPTLFIIALLSLMAFLEVHGDPAYWPLLLVGTMPGGLALFTLTIVFMMDYNLKNQLSDFLAAVCCAVANLCPLLILTLERFRGFTVLPLVLASFGFFFGHFHELRKRLDAAMFDPDGERVLFDD